MIFVNLFVYCVAAFVYDRTGDTTALFFGMAAMVIVGFLFEVLEFDE